MARKYPFPPRRSQRSAVRSGVVAIASILVSLASSGSAQSPEWFGTWTLNLDKSAYDPGPTPYKRATMKVEPLTDGRVRFSYDFVFRRGGVQHIEWDGRFDGKDYIVQGTDEYVTYAYRQTAARTYEITAKLDSRTTAMAVATMSADGRTLITTTRRNGERGEIITNTTVYEKKREGQLGLQGEGLHFEPSDSFLKWELVTKS
jgi:hypothetical protein